MNLYWKETPTTKRSLLTSNEFTDDSISFEVELMNVPRISFEIPIEVFTDSPIPDGVFEFILEFDNGNIFHGQVIRKEYDLVNNVIKIDAEHIIKELEHQRVPTNYAVNELALGEMFNYKTYQRPKDSKAADQVYFKEKVKVKDGDKEETKEVVNYVDKDKIDGLFNDKDWTYKFTDNSSDVIITYLFSNQNKLQALTDTLKQTEDVFWRVSLTEERTIEIGRFGDYKELVITGNNLLAESLTLTEDFQDVCNYAIYFTDKSDSGTTALTLRDMYNHPDMQNENFPIIETGEEINTERRYNYLDLIPFGANNQGDYAILDKEGIALESGHIFEKAFTSNDIQTVARDTNKELTDEDRLIASRQLYTQAIRKLIHSRRKVALKFTIDDLTPGTNVGDRVRFMFMAKVLKVMRCGEFFKNLLTVNDYFYISSLEQVVNVGGAMTYNLTIEKHIYNNGEV